jgi:predicted methyltransferase
MEKVITKDSSVTFYSEKYKETYRSISGAEEESVKKFVEPAKVAEKAKSGRIDILDVCFGLGYNSAAAIDAALKSNPNCKVSVLGLENDTEIISKIEEVNPSFQSYKIIKKLIKMHEISEKNIHIKLIIGDARNTIFAESMS